ncbi:acyl-CoA-binding protein [Pseudoxanthomonas sp. X-1]|uniref:acyl-CoA-binding protein n=1 Tax=Pseudoxanthomonas sp. X-1 TaxID=2571115 RepID=UPI000DB3FE18|nr:acyl-CoA-binding protein [Pseudoxanthomonas sp. X-1]PZP61958.1 MAG: acyl-CoA-binding protein [Pseudoxanthomonas spadix]TMN24768.1 acyl-CoA-binding protein [Pseudoxanthomonas sp. X-1]UAY73146.1 acyl-CoA-binding protein [Pseudoxanthomonas sp. X-1]
MAQTAVTEFEQATLDIQTLPERPDNDTLLRLYGLYKQGTEGDVHGNKPGFFDYVGSAKYEAWERLRGTPQDLAQRRYVTLVRELLDEAGVATRR